MKVKHYVLDTSVIVEYIDEESPFKDKIESLFNALRTGHIRAYITSTTIGETLYIATRIYREAGSADPNKDAEDFIQWVEKQPGTQIVNVTKEISILAGEIRRRARISLIDCIVIATGKILKAEPLFLKLEKEMEPYVNILLKYNVKFLVNTTGVFKAFIK